MLQGIIFKTTGLVFYFGHLIVDEVIDQTYGWLMKGWLQTPNLP